MTDLDYPTTEEYTKADVKRVQQRLFKMAIAIRDILEKNNIPYFLSSGSLIGAVRHGGFIPWDDDLDLYMFSDTYDIGISKLQEALPSDMFVEYCTTEPRYFHDWAHVKDLTSVCDSRQFPQDSQYEHKGISIDLYKMTQMPKRDWKAFKHEAAVRYINLRLKHGFITQDEYDRKVVQFDTKFGKSVDDDNGAEDEMVFGSSVSKHMFKCGDIIPLGKIDFCGETFSSPASINGFLTEIYGDYMTVVPYEDRHPHYSYVEFVE